MENNINFKGLLYGSNLRHVSKPVLCCHHGDAKFVRMLNNSAKKAPKIFFENNGVSFYRKEGVTCIKIKTKEIPGFNFLEKLFFDISPIQQKLINKRKENLFTDLIFHLNKFEFEFIFEFSFKFVFEFHIDLFSPPFMRQFMYVFSVQKAVSHPRNSELAYLFSNIYHDRDII